MSNTPRCIHMYGVDFHFHYRAITMYSYGNNNNMLAIYIYMNTKVFALARRLHARTMLM